MLRRRISLPPASSSKGRSLASLRQPVGVTTVDSNRFLVEDVLVTLKVNVSSLPGTVSTREPLLGTTAIERDWKESAATTFSAVRIRRQKNIRLGETGYVKFRRITRMSQNFNVYSAA